MMISTMTSTMISSIHHGTAVALLVTILIGVELAIGVAPLERVTVTNASVLSY